MSYEYQYVKFTSTNPVVLSGDGYDTGADYSLSDGADLKGNYTVPASSVFYSEKFFTISSEFDTGVPINDWRSGTFGLGLKFKKSSAPSNRIYFFKNNLGDSAITETLLYWDTDGQLYFDDRSFGLVTLNDWQEIDGTDTKTTAELLSFDNYNSICYVENSSGNGFITLNGYINTNDQTLNPLWPSNSSLNWTIDTTESIDLFNVVLWESAVSNATLIAYNDAGATESGGITFPDGSTDTEFILSTQVDDLGYGSSGRTIFNKNVEIKDIRYQIGNDGLQNIQNCRINFDNVDSFYHQMRELNGSDFWVGLKADVYWASGRVPSLVFGDDGIYDDGAVFSFYDGKNTVTGNELATSGGVTFNGKLVALESGARLFLDDVFNKKINKNTSCAFWFNPSQEWVDNDGIFGFSSPSGNAYFWSRVDYDTTVSSPPNSTSIRVWTNSSGSGSGAHEKFYPSSGVSAGNWYYVLITNEGTNGNVDLNGYTATAIQNYSYGNNRSGSQLYLTSDFGACQFYGLTFWDGDPVYSDLQANYPTNSPRWAKDGETVVSFTPSTSYPLTDSIKKEFSGFIESASMNTKKTSLSLVSQEKQDSFYVGTIQSGNGADGSRAKISPIVVGDMTDDEAYVPLVLNNNLYTVPQGVCSDVDLSEAPTPFVYDDESELYHEVINEQTFVDNRKIVFYDSTVSDFSQRIGEYISMDGNKEAETVQRSADGEIMAKFSDNEAMTLLGNTYGESDYRTYIQDFNVTREEGTRNYDGLTDFSEVDTPIAINPMSADIYKALAKIKVSIYPTGIRNVPDADFAYHESTIDPLLTYIRYNLDNTWEDHDVTTYECRGLDPINTDSSGLMECIGQYKGVLDYRNFNSTAYPYPIANDSTNPNYLQFSPSHGTWDIQGGTTVYSGPNKSSWYALNYQNFATQRLTFDWSPFKFTGDITGCNFHYMGGVQYYFKLENYTGTVYADYPSPAVQMFFTDKDSVEQRTDLWEKRIETVSGVEDYSNHLKVQANYQPFFNTVDDFKNANFSLRYTGWSYVEPSTSSITLNTGAGTWSGTPDYQNGSYGRHNFFLEGLRFDLDVSALVESKYWCFKGKTGTDLNLLAGLNQLASRYTNGTVTARDLFRNSYKISGAHTGEPIYYRDLLSKIANEFKVIITDDNGTSELISKGQAGVSWTFDESNVFAPFGDNITYGETPSTEIYNKIVVRYAKNHMTDSYGKTLEITKDSSTFTTNIVKDASYNATVTSIQSQLSNADAFLTKINVTEKVLTIDLDWVRDDNTAIALAYWNARNYSRQRSKVSINVGKRYFLNGKLGDGVRLDLPQLPLFYQSVMQVTKIVNKSNKTFTVELEEYL